MGDTRIDQLVKRWGSCDKLNDSESEQLIGLLLAERDSLQSKLSEATTRIERMENLFFLAMDFIDKHPADPDISKDQTESWLKILNSNAMDEFARLRQQSKSDEPS